SHPMRRWRLGQAECRRSPLGAVPKPFRTTIRQAQRFQCFGNATPSAVFELASSTPNSRPTRVRYWRQLRLSPCALQLAVTFRARLRKQRFSAIRFLRLTTTRQPFQRGLPFGLFLCPLFQTALDELAQQFGYADSFAARNPRQSFSLVRAN